ncbi:MAG TPA: nuclear transport factor 2 family protein [Solirubrobacterales bacterium]|nr:nuclear transport factor 2 family protein [Solirubrobacterales bacterium]
MAEENVEIVRRLVDAFNRDDVREVVAAFDENCELDEPPEMPDARGFRGRDGIREWMTNLRETGAVHFAPRSFRISGDLVVSEWAASGRGQVSEVPFEWTTFVVFRIRDGKVVRAQAFLSAKEALEAAGLSE